MKAIHLESTMLSEEQCLNESAYRRLEPTIKSIYPPGQYVAIAGGAIVGDAGDFMALHKQLKAAGRDPRQVLIVQAGHVYPQETTIFRMG
jgi:hypothetical protein